MSKTNFIHTEHQAGVIQALFLIAIAFVSVAAHGQSNTIPSAAQSKESQSTGSRCEPPAYPAQAMREGIQGTTKIRFEVDETGEVRSAEVLSSSGSQLLDSTAVAALSACKFKPGMRDGRAVSARTVVEYQWKMATSQ